MPDDRHPNIKNEADIEWEDNTHGDKFHNRSKALGYFAGSQKLGCSLYEQPPGKTAWPYHCHYANEEALYVLAGEGTLRIGAKEVPLRAGDYVAFPVGDATAHQIINTSDAPLRYLCFSTMLEPEIVKYPDSGKISAAAGHWLNRSLRAFFRAETEVDYWDREG